MNDEGTLCDAGCFFFGLSVEISRLVAQRRNGSENYRKIYDIPNSRYIHR